MLEAALEGTLYFAAIRTATASNSSIRRTLRAVLSVVSALLGLCALASEQLPRPCLVRQWNESMSIGQPDKAAFPQASPMSHPRTPLLTVDIIIELGDGRQESIVLIERRNPPLGWALPGGFVDVGEPVEQAARREAAEETGLQVHLRRLLGVYSAPDRDPRGHTVSVVFIGQADGEPHAADDAKQVCVCKLKNRPQELAFDHQLILTDYERFLKIGELPPLHRAD
jgi:8-oxo-dGTP diphosphatase